MSESILVARELGHTFNTGSGEVTPYDGLSFAIERSRIMAVRGESGCGKTTLLLVCGGMRAPTRGEVTLNGQNLYDLPSAARGTYRSNHVGYLFQTLQLIPYLSVLQNVKLARGVDDATARTWLDRLGLSHRLSHKPRALSHGERQRVALARSMAHQPSLVICDEPTGNLDEDNTRIVFEALREYADKGGAVLIASHDSQVNELADEAWSLSQTPDAPQVGASNSRSTATPRTGSVTKLSLFIMCSLVIVTALSIAALKLRPDAARGTHIEANKIRIYCAAGVAKPVEQVIEVYNRNFGDRVEIVRTGGSGELAGQIKAEFETGVQTAADLYLSADDVLLKRAHAEGIIAERFYLAEQRPVIAVRSDSSMDLTSLGQLVADKGLKYGLASEQAAVGKIVRAIANREGFVEQLESQKTTDTENVMMLAQALSTGSLDAAILWDTTVNQLNQVGQDNVLKVAAYADPANQLKSTIGIGVLSTTQQPTEALKFCRFLTGSNEAREAFERLGFNFIPGDRWEEVPEIHLYCGSMFTPVLEESIREFARREGVNVYPRWQGCGKLLASIKGTEDPELFPDAFLACDVSFLEPVRDHFEPYSLVSSNDIVLVIRKAIKEEIKSPADLLTKHIRFGICDPQQSALGALTQKLLDRPPFEGLYEQIYERANVVVDVGPTLVSQLMAEGLDAAVVYRSNVLADEKAASLLELVEIESEYATAKQPWAISKQTGNVHLMNRLFDWISTDQIRSRFSRFGFRETRNRQTVK